MTIPIGRLAYRVHRLVFKLAIAIVCEAFYEPSPECSAAASARMRSVSCR
jgi:hypothetical protein